MSRTCILFLLLLSVGCAQPSWIRNGYIARFDRGEPNLTADDPAYPHTVQVQWLGVEGFLVSLGDHAVLFPPLFSKQTIGKIGFQRIEVNTALIDSEMPQADNVEAIMIPHAHYDHILDVPHIMKNHATTAPAYGSKTAVNILAGWNIPEERRIEMPLEEWIYTRSRRIRFIAFRGSHAPHLAGILHLWNGTIEKPLSSPPKYAREYQEGTTLNYMVEFLDREEKPVYTLFYQDGVASGDTGLPSIDHRPVDLLLICVPGWDQVDEYPETTLRILKPGEIVLSHFDEFLQEPEEGLQFLRNCNVEGFLSRVQVTLEQESIPATITIPTLGARMRFPLSRP